ncbi:MAG: VCBS repeat-containing protein [Deltaproteobacteria bacterium]|nr:VCBS repeat-containing protein [Deltaproteobacteria bacterium]
MARKTHGRSLRRLALVVALVAAGCEASSDEDSGVVDSPALPWPEGVSLGPIRACAAPLPGPAYEEVGERWGLVAAKNPEADHLDGGGLLVADLNDDGALDIVVGHAKEPLRLALRQTLDTFEVRELPVNSAALSAADLSGDGLLDVLIGGEEPAWLESLGDGGFAQPVALPFVGRGVALIRSPAALDLEGDGDLDLFIPATAPATAEHAQDYLLISDGAGGLTEDRERLDPTLAQARAFSGLVLDLEGDGDPDVFVDNDMGAQHGGDVLWRNDGAGGLAEANADCACGIIHSGMGGDVGDVNNDGAPDLYLGATSANRLLVQDDGSFIDVTAATGADPLDSDQDMSWGVIFFDHDNDGLQDLLVAEGDLWAESHGGTLQDAPIHLLAQTDTFAFEDRAPALGLDRLGSWRAVNAADHNDDGVLDLIITEITDRPLVFLSTGCTEAGWIAVDAPLGSRVEVEAGGRTVVDWAHPQSGIGAAGPLRVHLGLGAAQEVDTLRVILPWGGGTITVPGPIPARRVITVEATP